MSRILFIKHGQLRQLDLSRPMILAATVVLGILIGGSLFLAGFGAASWFTRPLEGIQAWQARFTRQAQEIDSAKRVAQANIDALSAKVGELQAHIIRLDALGQQLTRMAGLNHGEFNFSKPPAWTPNNLSHHQFHARRLLTRTHEPLLLHRDGSVGRGIAYLFEKGQQTLILRGRGSGILQLGE